MASLVAQMVKNLLQCRRPGFKPWVVKILWRREKWLPTPVFLPGEFHDLGGLHSPWGYRVRHHWATDPFTFFHFLWQDCRSMATQWCSMCLCMVHHYLQHQTDCMLISQIRFPTSLSRKPESFPIAPWCILSYHPSSVWDLFYFDRVSGWLGLGSILYPLLCGGRGRWILW